MTAEKHRILGDKTPRVPCSSNGRWLRLFLFYYFGSQRLEIIQSGGCLHCCLCKHGSRHKAQENRSMAAKQEQLEPPRLISPSGAQIKCYCSGRRWYIGCIRPPVLFIPLFFDKLFVFGWLKGRSAEVKPAPAAGFGKQSCSSWPVRQTIIMLVRKCREFTVWQAFCQH